jgi:hypothetical protein
MELKHKTKAELEKLTPERLLAYFKSVRARTNAFIRSDEEGGFTATETQIEDATNYLELVKSVLATKPHVKK